MKNPHPYIDEADICDLGPDFIQKVVGKEALYKIDGYRFHSVAFANVIRPDGSMFGVIAPHRKFFSALTKAVYRAPYNERSVRNDRK